ncbi:MAG: hypothetical protein ACRC3J_02430 [Culicoidibacterales bacterium]
MGQTIYAKMTKDLDGVVLELVDFGHHIMGATLEEASGQVVQYLQAHALTKQPTTPEQIKVANQELIAFQM